MAAPPPDDAAESPSADAAEDVTAANAEDFYFRFAEAQEASARADLRIDAELAAAWVGVLARRWPELAPMATCARVEEIAARLAFSGVSPASAATLNPPDLAATCGVSLSDAVVVISALRWESVGEPDKRAGMHAAARATARFHPRVSDLNFVDPHAPDADITLAAVHSVGARAAIQDSDRVHGLIAFVVTLFIWDDLPFVKDVPLAAPPHAGAFFTPRAAAAQALEMFTVALRVTALFCAITVSIATQSAKDSDYTACNFLAIPYAVRYADAWLFAASWLLSVARASLIVREQVGAEWRFATYLASAAAVVALSAAYMFVMFMRVRTSTLAPRGQWFRWFPCGERRTRRAVSALLLRAGNYAKHEYHKELRSAICAALARLAFVEPKSDIRVAASPLGARDAGAFSPRPLVSARSPRSAFPSPNSAFRPVPHPPPAPRLHPAPATRPAPEGA